MSRCIVLMSALAFVVSSAYAQAPAPAPAKVPVVKVTAKAVVVVPPAKAPAKVAPAKAAPAPAAPAPASAPVAKSVQPVTAVAASQPVIAEPKTVTEAIVTAKQGVEFAKTRNWFGLSACAIFIIMFMLNAFKLFDKIGKRWAYIILPVLGVAAMLLSRFAGGLSWEAAIAVLTSAPCTGLLWDFFKRGILAKETETPMKPVANAPTEPTK